MALRVLQRLAGAFAASSAAVLHSLVAVRLSPRPEDVPITTVHPIN